MAESAHLWLYLIVGLIASLLLATGLALMKSRGEALPAAAGKGIPSAVYNWLCDPIWLAGLVIEIAGYVLYFAALADAPVSLVAVMMQGGIAAFVILAVVFLHERANLGEAVGILGIVVAMVLLALSLRSGAAEGGTHPLALAAISGGSVVAALAPWLAEKLRTNGAAPAIASGIAFGLGSLYTKALADIFAAHSGFAIVVWMASSPWPYLMIAANLLGLILLQNSFHWARGIIVLPLSSSTSNVLPIIGGLVAFGEALPPGTFSAALRITAYALTVLAAVMLARAEATIVAEI